MNKVIDCIKNKIIFSSDNFNKDKTTCLEYGGLNEVILSFKINGKKLNISIDPDCFYCIDGTDYVNSMVSEEDMDEYRKGNFDCWYMNCFFIETECEKFKFHDMNEDFDRFSEFLENIKNNNN